MNFAKSRMSPPRSRNARIAHKTVVVDLDGRISPLERRATEFAVIPMAAPSSACVTPAIFRIRRISAGVIFIARLYPAPTVGRLLLYDTPQIKRSGTVFAARPAQEPIGPSTLLYRAGRVTIRGEMRRGM